MITLGFVLDWGHRVEVEVKVGARIGVMWPQAKECWWSPERRETHSLGTHSGNRPCWRLGSGSVDFRTWENTVLLF